MKPKRGVRPAPNAPSIIVDYGAEKQAPVRVTVK